MRKTTGWVAMPPVRLAEPSGGAAASLVVKFTVSMIVLIKLKYLSTALTVAVTKLPASTELGVPIRPKGSEKGLPGSET